MTAGGKNVAPAVLEDRLRAHPLVSQCLVVGDGRRSSPPWSPSTREAVRAGRRPTASTPRVADLVDDPDLRAEVQEAVDDGQPDGVQGRGDPEVHDPARRTGPRRAASSPPA